MFADTITITINSVARILTRVNQDGYSSEYLLRDALSEFRLTIRNTSYVDKTRGGRKVDRHTCQLIQTVYPISPATAGTVRKSYQVIENDQLDGVTEPLNFTLGFIGFFTNTNITKMLNWES